MKTVVLDRDFLELEIKPQAMLDKYRKLLAQEVQSMLATPDSLTPIPCPGCRSDDSSPVFEKFGLTYHQCERCHSVYVSPRPSEEALADFYRNSKAANYWREKILPETMEKRREKLYRPRVHWLLDVLDRYRPEVKLGISVGYHNSLLIAEMQRQEKDLFSIVVTNPIADIELEGMASENIRIQPTTTDALASLAPADVFLTFDILDRSTDPDLLFASAQAGLAPGGILLASTTLISGFDLQVLWDRSKTIYPPDRLNLFSVEGLTTLLERHGFEMLEFSTPGMFDVEIVRRTILSDPQAEWPRFIRYLVENRDEHALNALQEYLQRFRLSSFARIVGRKPA
ncbi:MAG: hypothetical protein PVI78_04100 [Anaerolineales bacterium]|jgi:hypothetical protein